MAQVKAISVVPGVDQPVAGDQAAQRQQTLSKMEQDEDYFLNAHEGFVYHYDKEYPAGELPRAICDFFSVVDTARNGRLDAKELDEAADIIRIAKKANGGEQRGAELQAHAAGGRGRPGHLGRGQVGEQGCNLASSEQKNPSPNNGSHVAECSSAAVGEELLISSRGVE